LGTVSYGTPFPFCWYRQLSIRKKAGLFCSSNGVQMGDHTTHTNLDNSPFEHKLVSLASLMLVRNIAQSALLFGNNCNTMSP